MAKWYALIGILASLLVISVGINVYGFGKIHELEEETQLLTSQKYNDGYTKGSQDAREYWLNAGYDVGNYDGWLTGYERGYDDGTDYGQYLAGKGSGYSYYAITDTEGDWRAHWRELGIYDKEYEGPYPR